jgi:hypothetical protein
MSQSSVLDNPPHPPYNYADHAPKPKVTYIKREEEANDMVAKLNGQVTLSPPFLFFSFTHPNNLPSAIGLDLEWPFSREGGKEIEGKVSLVQLCDVRNILLIHVSKMESVYTVSLSRPYLVY